MGHNKCLNPVRFSWQRHLIIEKTPPSLAQARLGQQRMSRVHSKDLPRESFRTSTWQDALLIRQCTWMASRDLVQQAKDAGTRVLEKRQDGGAVRSGNTLDGQPLQLIDLPG